MFRLICLCIGYCIGCIETAYVVGRIWQVDLRQHGSGNLGTTNALRVLGKKAGALVFIGDIMKSVRFLGATWQGYMALSGRFWGTITPFT